MAASVPRTASGLANTLRCAARPRCQFIAPATRRYLQQDAAASEAAATETSERPTYEKKPQRLEYKPIKRYQNVRPQPVAPFPTRVRQPYLVNDSPKKLDEMYAELFGEGEEFTLPKELKWQAATHKSFDHGRQPYNEKLAYLGKSLLRMHAAISILGRPSKDDYAVPSEYKSLEGAVYQQPEPFVSPDYLGVSNVNPHAISKMVTQDAFDPIIRRTGLANVMRWKPMNVNDLSMSGRSAVAAECLKAIVGAVALHHGGDAAGRFINTRILNHIAKA